MDWLSVDVIDRIGLYLDEDKLGVYSQTLVKRWTSEAFCLYYYKHRISSTINIISILSMLNMLNMVKETNDKDTKIYNASKYGYDHIFTQCLSDPSTIKDKDVLQNCLDQAINHRHLNIVKLILDPLFNTNWSVNITSTHLSISLGKGEYKMFKFLLKRLKKINKDEEDRKRIINDARSPTLLCGALDMIEFDSLRYKIVKLLIKLGALVDMKNEDGLSPLMIASSKGLVDIINLLLKNGADINITYSNGSIPLLFAAEAPTSSKPLQTYNYYLIII